MGLSSLVLIPPTVYIFQSLTYICSYCSCRAIQKTLEFISVEQSASLVGELERHLLECVKSSNANHVIQKIISLPSPSSGVPVLGFVAAFKGNGESRSVGSRTASRLEADHVLIWLYGSSSRALYSSVRMVSRSATVLSSA